MGKGVPGMALIIAGMDIGAVIIMVITLVIISIPDMCRITIIAMRRITIFPTTTHIIIRSRTTIPTHTLTRTSVGRAIRYMIPMPILSRAAIDDCCLVNEQDMFRCKPR